MRSPRRLPATWPAIARKAIIELCQLFLRCSVIGDETCRELFKGGVLEPSGLFRFCVCIRFHDHLLQLNRIRLYRLILRGVSLPQGARMTFSHVLFHTPYSISDRLETEVSSCGRRVSSTLPSLLSDPLCSGTLGTMNQLTRNITL
jgi:hypothetical protein